MVLEGLYTLSISILTFWMPTVYTFKFLMEKDVKRIPTILKFWCMISCFNLISVLLSKVVDENIFPWINFICLVVLNLPPYEISEKIYDSTLGSIYKQNKKSFDSLEETLIGLFNKNTETLKNKMKNSTSDKLKGIVGDVLMATLRNNQGGSNKGNSKRGESSDEESEKADN